MTREYRPRHSIPLEPATTFRRPARALDWVQLDDTAMSVFTDFLEVEPRTVSPDEPIDEALERMKAAAVHLLLVDDDAETIHGERPIQLAQERRVPRTELVVRDIMTPQAEISVLNMVSVDEACARPRSPAVRASDYARVAGRPPATTHVTTGRRRWPRMSTSSSSWSGRARNPGKRRPPWP